MPGSASPREKAGRRRVGPRASRDGSGLSEARTRELFRRYKEEGDEDAREQLILGNQRLVQYIARQYMNKGVPLEDLVQEGNKGLIDAVDRYDPSFGTTFSTYATPTIFGVLKKYFRDRAWSMRVPRRLQELSAKVRKATDELTKSENRTPTVQEIADYLGVSVEEVLNAGEASHAYSSISLEGGGGQEDDEAPSVIDYYANEDTDLASSDERLDLMNALEKLTPREREVLDMRYGDSLTQAQIAEKLNTSQVQISRLLKRTESKLHDAMGSRG